MSGTANFYDENFLNSKGDKIKEISITDSTEERLRTAGNHIRTSSGELITTYDGIIQYLLDEFWK